MVRDNARRLGAPRAQHGFVHLSMAGSEYTLAMGLARLGISIRVLSRACPPTLTAMPLRNTARENGLNTDYLVWAPRPT